MVRSVEIRAVLEGIPSAPQFHGVYLLPEIEISLDCFVCERTGRTMILKSGTESAVCSSDKEHGRHPAPARITAFDSTTGDGQLILRGVVDYWWAPFHDAKRDAPAVAITRGPWVRLGFGYHCSEQPNRGGTSSIQSNLVRPYSATCDHCQAVIATSREAPRIRSLG